MTHVRDRIQALCDGELTAREAAAVREHCLACEECGRALRETEALWRLVDADPEPVLPRPVWPALAVRAARKRRSAAPAHGGWSFAGVAIAATVAGILLGFWIGGHGVSPDKDGLRTLLEEGAVIVDGGETTLDQLYLAPILGEGGQGS